MLLSSCYSSFALEGTKRLTERDTNITCLSLTKVLAGKYTIGILQWSKGLINLLTYHSTCRAFVDLTSARYKKGTYIPKFTRTVLWLLTVL